MSHEGDRYLFAKPEETDGVRPAPQTAGPIHTAGPARTSGFKFDRSLYHEMTVNKETRQKGREWRREKSKEDSLNLLPSDLGHDGALSSQILVTQTQEVVDDKG